MSGHSKWSTIKRQKAVTDAKRSAAFTKLGRQITVAARLGGGDPLMNFRLRLAIDKAKAGNMPNDNIDRAIKAGTGEGKDSQTKDVLYEGFGPGGVAIMVEAITDNPNRSAAEVRTTFTKHGGSMGGQNSVGWMFTRSGVIRLPKSSVSDDQVEALELLAIDAGATDVSVDGDELVIITPVEQLRTIHETVAATAPAAEADVEFVPTTTTAIDPATQEKLHALLGSLDDLDDVTRVTSNEA
jgi:YebC/PmpR family DNA-binding regulatory protein